MTLQNHRQQELVSQSEVLEVSEKRFLSMSIRKIIMETFPIH